MIYDEYTRPNADERKNNIRLTIANATTKIILSDEDVENFSFVDESDTGINSESITVAEHPGLSQLSGKRFLKIELSCVSINEPAHYVHIGSQKVNYIRKIDSTNRVKIKASVFDNFWYTIIPTSNYLIEYRKKYNEKIDKYVSTNGQAEGIRVRDLLLLTLEIFNADNIFGIDVPDDINNIYLFDPMICYSETYREKQTNIIESLEKVSGKTLWSYFDGATYHICYLENSPAQTQPYPEITQDDYIEFNRSNNADYGNTINLQNRGNILLQSNDILIVEGQERTIKRSQMDYHKGSLSGSLVLQ